jgi:hypothetical protein
MASSFSTSVAALEKELAALIVDNQIQARIDSHNKLLYARHADIRNATFQKVSCWLARPGLAWCSLTESRCAQTCTGQGLQDHMAGVRRGP